MSGRGFRCLLPKSLIRVPGRRSRRDARRRREGPARVRGACRRAKIGYNCRLSALWHKARDGRRSGPRSGPFNPIPARSTLLQQERPTMKSRLFALLTAFSLAVTLAACGDSAKEAADKAAAATKAAADKAAAAAKETADKAAAAAKDAATASTDAASKAADATKDAAGKAVEATKDTASKAADATKEAAGKATDAAKDAMAPKIG